MANTTYLVTNSSKTLIALENVTIYPGLTQSLTMTDTQYDVFASYHGRYLDFQTADPDSSTIDITRDSRLPTDPQHVIVDNAPDSNISGSVSVTNFPTIQPVSGTISAAQSGAWSVNIGNFPATQTIAGAVTVSNFPATQAVSGTLAATQSGAWTVSISNFPATQTIAGSVSVSNFPATQAVSSVQLPTTIGQKASAASLSVDFASNGLFATVVGAKTDTPWDGISASPSEISILKAIWNRLGATVPANAVPLGYGQITNLTTAVPLPSVPANTRYVLITVSGATVRYRDDGTLPTATLGFPLPIGAIFEYNGSLANINFIQQTAGATLDYCFYG